MLISRFPVESHGVKGWCRVVAAPCHPEGIEVVSITATIRYGDTSKEFGGVGCEYIFPDTLNLQYSVVPGMEDRERAPIYEEDARVAWQKAKNEAINFAVDLFNDKAANIEAERNIQHELLNDLWRSLEKESYLYEEVL